MAELLKIRLQVLVRDRAAAQVTTDAIRAQLPAELQRFKATIVTNDALADESNPPDDD